METRKWSIHDHGGFQPPQLNKKGIVHAETVYLVLVNELLIAAIVEMKARAVFGKERKSRMDVTVKERHIPKTTTNKRNINTPTSSFCYQSTSISISPLGLHCSRSLCKFRPSCILVVWSRLLWYYFFSVLVLTDISVLVLTGKSCWPITRTPGSRRWLVADSRWQAAGVVGCTDRWSSEHKNAARSDVFFLCTRTSYN